MDLTKEINDFYYHMALHELQIMNESDYYNGLSYNSLLYINVVAQMENCTVSKIADALNITRSAVTIKLNELAKQGAIVKTQSEDDKRVFFIKLSPDMEKKTRIDDRVFCRIGADLQKKYSQRQLKLFQEILHTISTYQWGDTGNE